MSQQLSDASLREERLGAVLVACLEAADQGRPFEPHEVVARYPEFASELNEFFQDQQDVDRLAGPLRAVAGAGGTVALGAGATVHESSPSQPDPKVGSLGDYEVLGEIARGGMGVVFKARQKSLGRLVALKMVPEGGTPDEVRRFRNEAEMAAGLDHPGIVPVHEVGQHAGQLYFSMKLFEGGSLAQHLDRYRNNPKGAVRLLAAVARAVHHAHQRGILHRDLKPSNILLDAEGQPHVTDFGLAKRVEVDTELTQSGALVGTPSYMAPEQTTGRRGEVTTATDVYGLGAVLYALVTGRPPFRAETVLDTLVLVREAPPEPPRRVNRGVDRDLEAVCLKCLHKDPSRRYSTAEALAEDLGRWLSGEPTLARPAGRLERLGRWARRHRLAVGVAACLLLTLTALAGSAGWVLGDRAARQREAEDKVREALAAVAPGLREGNPYDPALIAAVERAEAQLGGGLLGPELHRQVEQLRQDRQMLTRLDQARQTTAAGSTETGFDFAGADRLYARAFADYGLDLTALESSEAAGRVRASAIATHLVTALDDWA
jgi:hypothetical protein